MSDKKIVDLQLRTSVIDTVNFPGDDGIQSYRMTAAQIFAYIRSKFVTTIRTISAAGSSLVSTDIMVLLDPTSGAFTQMLPAAATLTGVSFDFKNIATANNVTLDGNSTELIDAAETLVLQPGDAVRIYSNGTKWIITLANLTAVRSRIDAAERIPYGVILPFAGPAAPSGFLLCDGSALSRSTYAALFAAITVQLSATTTNASTSVTNLSSTSLLGVGMPVSGAGIPAGATIASIVNSTSITLSANATATGSLVALTFAPHGVGDGSTTFTLPDSRATYLRSQGAQTIGGRAFSSGTLGSKAKDLTAQNGLGLGDPGHSHGAPSNNATIGGGATGFTGGSRNDFGTGYTYGAGTGMYLTAGDAETKPATLVVNHIIKY